MSEIPRWYFIRDGQEQGPVTDQQLKDLARSGQLQPTHKVRRGDLDKPMMAAKVQGLVFGNLAFKATPPPSQPATKARVATAPHQPTQTRPITPVPIQPPPQPASPTGTSSLRRLIVIAASTTGAFVVLCCGGLGFLGALIQPQKHAGGLARSPVIGGKKSGLLDVRGKTVFECDDIVNSLSEGLAVIQRGDKYGYADTKGRIVIPPKYKAAGNFSEGLAAVELDDKTFCIDKKGNIAVQCEYSITGEFSDGVATILQIVHRAKPDRLGMKDRFLHGIVNKQGKILILPRFDSLSKFSNGRAVFALGEDADSTVYGIVDKAGNYVLKPTPKSFIGVYGGYGSLEHGFSDGLVVYADEAAMLNGYLDLDGRMAIPASKCRCEQGFAGRFSEGLAAITVGLGRERLRNLGRGGSFDTLPPDYMKVGYIDKTGEFAITPRFDGGQGRPFSEGLAAVRPTKDSKWGYIDRHGNMVISPQFDNAEEFTQGVAVVGVGKLYGLIDNTGAFVVKPQFARIGEFSDGLATFERP